MSRDTPYVIGTIVEAEFLNELQEAQTGTIWGLTLRQPSASTTSVLTNVAGDATDNQSSIIIGGQRRWLQANSNTAAASGLSGLREIRAYTDVDDGDELALVRDFSIEVVPPAGPFSGSYSRVIGYGDWDSSTNTLSNIRLANGVQADASQYNSFTFQSIGRGNSDVPVTIAGYTSQNSDSSKMLSIGADDGGGYNERFYVTGKGLLTSTPDTSTDLVFVSQPTGATTNTFTVSGEGELCWGDGTLATDVCISRNPTSPETLILEGATGNGIFDTIYIQNSNSTDGTYPGTLTGAVNFLDDINMVGGSTIYVDGGNPVDLEGIAHLDEIETFTAVHTWDADMHMADTRNIVFDGSGEIRALQHTLGSENVLTAGVLGSANITITADGSITWGTVNPVVLSYGANFIQVAAGDQIRVPQDPVNGDDLTRKDYVDNEITTSSSSSRAFAFFIGS